MHRDIGKSCLGTKLKKENNIRIIEKAINDIVCKNTQCCVDTYKWYIYQTTFLLSKGENLQEILSDIKSNKMGWNQPKIFMNYINEEAEEDDFLENPFEIEEGVLECGKCGSKKVYSYSKQDRAGDEATSVFAYCIQCKSKWRAN